MICENCGMVTKPYNDGGCEFGDHQVTKEEESTNDPS